MQSSRTETLQACMSPILLYNRRIYFPHSTPGQERLYTISAPFVFQACR